MPRLSTEDRGRALGLLQTNLSSREVARRLHCSHRTIQRLNRRYRQTNSVADLPRSGRPRVTTHRDDRHMERLHLQNRFLTAEHTARTYRGPNGPISGRTVRRRLQAAGLYARRPYVGPNLTQQHRQRRLLWARQHLRWVRREWNQVVFSDESRFTVTNADGRVRVWRRFHERFRDCCVFQHNRGGGGSIMIWGAFSSQNRTPLVIIRGMLTGQRYRDEILQPVLLPFLRANPQLRVFQQDNATPHTSRVAMNFLQQNNVYVMPWPSLSPDMAPIEHAWDELGRRIRRGPPVQDIHDLRQRLVREWAAIPQAFFQRLVGSMRSRCQECVNGAGGHTRY